MSHDVSRTVVVESAKCVTHKYPDMALSVMSRGSPSLVSLQVALLIVVSNFRSFKSGPATYLCRAALQLARLPAAVVVRARSRSRVRARIRHSICDARRRRLSEPPVPVPAYVLSDKIKEQVYARRELRSREQGRTAATAAERFSPASE